MAAFEEQWTASNFPGWEGVKAVDSLEPISLKHYESAAALEELGADALKTGLMALGLKCGGTVQDRAERLFSTKGLKPEQFDKAILAKKSAKVRSGAQGCVCVLCVSWHLCLFLSGFSSFPSCFFLSVTLFLVSFSRVPAPWT